MNADTAFQIWKQVYLCGHQTGKTLMTYTALQAEVASLLAQVKSVPAGRRNTSAISGFRAIIRCDDDFNLLAGSNNCRASDRT